MQQTNDVVRYYRAKLLADEDGLCVFFERYASVHETESYSYCVPEGDIPRVKGLSNFEKISMLKAAKQLKLMKRVHKSGGRFAFANKQDALSNLLFRKRRQIKHMLREIRFAEALIDKVMCVEDLRLDTGLNTISDWHIVPETKDLVREYLVFE